MQGLTGTDSSEKDFSYTGIWWHWYFQFAVWMSPLLFFWRRGETS